MPNILGKTEYNTGNVSKIGALLPVCYLCDTTPDLGMRDGFYLRGIFICSSCELKLVESDPWSEPNYQEHVKNVKKILFNKDS